MQGSSVACRRYGAPRLGLGELLSNFLSVLGAIGIALLLLESSSNRDAMRRELPGALNHREDCEAAGKAPSSASNPWITSLATAPSGLILPVGQH